MNYMYLHERYITLRKAFILQWTKNGDDDDWRAKMHYTEEQNRESGKASHAAASSPAISVNGQYLYAAHRRGQGA